MPRHRRELYNNKYPLPYFHRREYSPPFPDPPPSSPVSDKDEYTNYLHYQQDDFENDKVNQQKVDTNSFESDASITTDTSVTGTSSISSVITKNRVVRPLPDYRDDGRDDSSTVTATKIKLKNDDPTYRPYRLRRGQRQRNLNDATHKKSTVDAASYTFAADRRKVDDISSHDNSRRRRLDIKSLNNVAESSESDECQPAKQQKTMDFVCENYPKGQSNPKNKRDKQDDWFDTLIQDIIRENVTESPINASLDTCLKLLFDQCQNSLHLSRYEKALSGLYHLSVQMKNTTLLRPPKRPELSIIRASREFEFFIKAFLANTEIFSDSFIDDFGTPDDSDILDPPRRLEPLDFIYLTIFSIITNLRQVYTIFYFFFF